MQDLKVALVQLDIVWENPEANRRQLETLVSGVEADVMVLPEMFSTGFSMSPAGIAERHETSATLAWMQKMAREKNCALVGSITIEDNGNYYNRAYFVTETGQYFAYDKRHLFSMAGEHKSFTAGKEKTVISYKGWNINIFICYDLRFPVWSRNDGSNDLYIYVANWPEARVSAWEALLCARAIENQCYVLGVNRVGIDGNGIQYNGRSLAFDSKGQLMAETEDYKEQVIQLVLIRSDLEDFRKKFPVANDADQFTLI